MWSLIITVVFLQQPGHMGSASMLSVPGFTSEGACVAAGKSWFKANTEALEASSRSNISALCVRNELPAAREPAQKFLRGPLS